MSAFRGAVRSVGSLSNANYEYRWTTGELRPLRDIWVEKLINQVSWMAARAINNRFRGLFGYKDDDEEGFPSPEDVYKKDVLVLKSAGLSMRKAEYGKLSTAL